MITSIHILTHIYLNKNVIKIYIKIHIQHIQYNYYYYY